MSVGSGVQAITITYNRACVNPVWFIKACKPIIVDDPFSDHACFSDQVRRYSRG